MKNVIVIGAGAAGLMAAYAAAKNGNSVLVLERNEKAGKKIYITGKGRCNVTNNVQAADFLENVVRNSKFLRGCIYSFPPEKLISLLEEGGLRLKTERGNRVFPVSDHASDVTACLLRLCASAEVKIEYNARVQNIKKEGEQFSVHTPEKEYFSDAVVVCTGGLSYPGTGSTGDGYGFAESFGLQIVPCRPSLCGIECDIKGLEKLQGLSLRNIRLTARFDGKEIYSDFGEMLFTHFGISGPLVLSLSAYLNELPLARVKLELDCKPALDELVLDKRLLRDFDKFKNKQMQNALDELLPKSLICPVLDQAGIAHDCPVHSLMREQRTRLIGAVKHFVLRPRALRPISEAVVTAGGVDVKQLNPKSMECKTVPGLFFCGEVIDADALTGGFNLHIAFATGYASGYSIQ